MFVIIADCYTPSWRSAANLANGTYSLETDFSLYLVHARTVDMT